jgi:triosephosphate isomerase
MYHFIINSKNYLEAAGANASKLALAVEKAKPSTLRSKVKFYLAVPAFSISELAGKFTRVPIIAQHLDIASSGSTTGFLVPEIAKISGAQGSIVNHSEHRIGEFEIEKAVSALRKLRMKSFVCARDTDEIERFARFRPDFIAIEPPELIGTGRAISKARPELITESVVSLKKVLGQNPTTLLLCGAGIIEENDVRRAKELGAKGILVASGVIKARRWADKISSLAGGFFS